MKKADVKLGSRVLWGGLEVTVERIEARGVVVDYWGRGLREGEYVTHVVPARDLTAK